MQNGPQGPFRKRTYVTVPQAYELTTVRKINENSFPGQFFMTERARNRGLRKRHPNNSTVNRVVFLHGRKTDHTIDEENTIDGSFNFSFDTIFYTNFIKCKMQHIICFYMFFYKKYKNFLNCRKIVDNYLVKNYSLLAER